MILTNEELYNAIDAIPDEEYDGYLSYGRAIEAAIIAKLGDPVAWREFDGEGGYDYRSYEDNENFRDEYIKRNPNSIYRNWVEPLYRLPEIKP